MDTYKNTQYNKLQKIKKVNLQESEEGQSCKANEVKSVWI